MKLRACFLFTLLISALSLMAQDNEGEVTLYQDDAIKNLIGAPRNNTSDSGSESNNDSTTVLEENYDAYQNNDGRRGNFRVQVFSGNQKNSRKEATSKRNLVKERFPQLQADIQYDSPVWQVRVGYYTNRADAEAALHELKNTFPSFGREMYIVRVAPKK